MRSWVGHVGGVRAVGKDEARMPSKDKGGKHQKQAASQTLKEKRKAKADKKAAKARDAAARL